jgi:hypothetical protein
MTTKEEIIEEIKRTAKENEGVPLGARRFEKETGITCYEWGQHWARFGDALLAAGFPPNPFQGAYPDEFLIQKVVALARKLGSFPTFRDFAVAKSNDPGMPDKKSFQRFGSKHEIVQKVAAYCQARSGFDDVIQLCSPILSSPPRKEAGTPDADAAGEVYLFKSGKYYKIGKTFDLVRRGAEIRVQLPERLRLIHSIKTDDPAGVEAYWHRRFATKCKNSEWFDLDNRDIKAFKRWKRIF